MNRSIAMLCLLAACTDGSSPYGPDRDDVSDIPAGDATGTTATGEYELQLYTADCLGDCPVIRSGIFSVSLCDVGEVDEQTVDVTQTDGRLVMIGEGLQVERLTGGVDADGTFEVGGWGTQNGGDVEVAILSTGTLAGARFTGTAESRGHGSIDGQSIDCTAVYEVAGAREP